MQLLKDDSHKILCVTQMIFKTQKQTYNKRSSQLLNMAMESEKLAKCMRFKTPNSIHRLA